jgi:hypothetical protein
VRVTGTVTVDGKPLPKGMLLLEPEGEGADRRRAFGEIIDGRIVLPEGRHDLRPGPYRVEIRWQQQTGRWIAKDKTEPAAPEVRELLPAKYHEKSELRADLRPGDNELTFDLRTQ